MRYLAKEHGLCAVDPVAAALEDAAFELSQEFAKVNPYVNIYDKDKDLDEFLSRAVPKSSAVSCSDFFF